MSNFFRVIEFKDIETAALAIDRMHRYEIKDRKLVVREVRLKGEYLTKAINPLYSGNL